MTEEIQENVDRTLSKGLMIIETIFEITGLLNYYITVDSEDEKPTIKELLVAIQEFHRSRGD